MIDGTANGNLIAFLYYACFQCLGIFIIFQISKKDRLSIAFRTLLGSVLGTVCLHWFPILFAFFVGFHKTGHILALLTMCMLAGIVFYFTRKTIRPHIENIKNLPKELLSFIRRNPILGLIVICFIYFVYCIQTHTIPENADGSLHTGQATYGDMNVHLSFITSIASQSHFPPNYPFYYGARLSYPFLCDSISASMYVFGASLRFAYMLPMCVACLQLFCGFYCFIKYWFKKTSTASFAWILFFLNGGLGFIYFLNKEAISRNFTDFYYTPTSLGDKNMRWAQIIVNMLIPQRATIFGWAILFTLLTILLYAVRSKSKKWFIVSGILAGALPMIHTHSFLSLGMICAVWLFWSLPIKRKFPKFSKPILPMALFIGFAFFGILQILNNNFGAFAEKNGFGILFFGLAIFALCFLYRLYTGYDKKILIEVLQTWGILLLLVLLLAGPQLYYWTFSQTGNSGFLQSHFNWDNSWNQYIWFYAKNIGLTFFLLIPGTLIAKRENLKIASPYLLIFFVAELIQFQPNTYDNNKLLFVGYALICGLSADCLRRMFQARWNMIAKILVGVAFAFLAFTSSFLTLGREWVSDYEIYPASEVKACKYITENTSPDAVFLTAYTHNESVVCLTGRTVVMAMENLLGGAYGFDYGQRKQDVIDFYADPVNHMDFVNEYQIDYIFISNTERGTIEYINEAAIATIADCIYAQDDVCIYQIRK